MPSVGARVKHTPVEGIYLALNIERAPLQAVSTASVRVSLTKLHVFSCGNEPDLWPSGRLFRNTMPSGAGSEFLRFFTPAGLFRVCFLCLSPELVERVLFWLWVSFCRCLLCFVCKKENTLYEYEVEGRYCSQ